MTYDNPELEDVKTQLDKLLDWAKSKKEESDVSSSPWKWILAAVAAVLVFCALSYMAYTAWNKGKELAKLKHQIDVAEESKKKAELEAKIATSEAIAAANLLFVQKTEKHVEKLKGEVDQIEKERLNLTEKIAKVTSWSDLDSLRKGDK